MRWKLEQQEKKLDALFLMCQKIEDVEQQAFMAKFLCVRASGFVESSFRHLISEYTDGTSPRQIQSYVNKKTKYVTNLNFEKVLELLSSFDNDWKEKFAHAINDEQKSALNTIVSNRNNIAHGENDSVSYVLMVDYYERVKEVVNLLKDIVRK